MSYDVRHVERARKFVLKAFHLVGGDRFEFAKCMGSSLRDANRWINFALNLHTNNKACPSTPWFLAICEFLEEEGGEKSLPSVFLCIFKLRTTLSCRGRFLTVFLLPFIKKSAILRSQN